MSTPGANRTCRDRENDVNDPGCVKTHTSAKCGKYNSPMRLRAARRQYDLTPAMRNFAEVLLHAYRALEFSHSQDPTRTSGRISRCSSEACFSLYQSTRLSLYDPRPRCRHR